MPFRASTSTDRKTKTIPIPRSIRLTPSINRSVTTIQLPPGTPNKIVWLTAAPETGERSSADDFSMGIPMYCQEKQLEHRDILLFSWSKCRLALDYSMMCINP
jgi:hypothetical protein